MKQDFLFVRAMENKLDGDVPLGVKLLKCELHPGGFWTRAEVVAKKWKDLALIFIAVGLRQFPIECFSPIELTRARAGLNQD